MNSNQNEINELIPNYRFNARSDRPSGDTLAALLGNHSAPIRIFSPGVLREILVGIRSNVADVHQNRSAGPLPQVAGGCWVHTSYVALLPRKDVHRSVRVIRIISCRPMQDLGGSMHLHDGVQAFHRKSTCLKQSS